MEGTRAPLCVRNDVPWGDAVRQTIGGRPVSPRQLRRRMRGEEKARQAAARRAKVKLQSAVGMLGVMHDQERAARAEAARAEAARAEVARAATEQAPEAKRAAEAEGQPAADAQSPEISLWGAAEARAQRACEEAQARRIREEADARERKAAQVARKTAAAAVRAEQVAEAAVREAADAVAKAAVAKLPWGWELHKSEKTGESYYFNTVTGDCTWEPPTEEAWGLEQVPLELRDTQCWVEVVQSRVLRSTVQLDSEVVGSSAPGELLFVLEFAHVPFGRGLRRARVRCYGGWLSVTAMDGSVAVQLAEAPPVTATVGSILSTTDRPIPVDMLLGDGDDLAASVDASESDVMFMSQRANLGGAHDSHARWSAAHPGSDGAQSDRLTSRVPYVPSLYKRSMRSTCQGHREYSQRGLAAAAR